MLRSRPIIGFEISYAGKGLFCEAVMRQTSYRIYFDGNFKVEIANAFGQGWYVTFGTILPAETIDTIGAHIEGRLD